MSSPDALPLQPALRSGPLKGAAQWDQRFAEPGYAYGEAPNAFLESVVSSWPLGDALSLAEGEGRNAVHLALRGHRVTAVDFSAVARNKALAWAARNGVHINYEIGDLASLELGADRWDSVVAVFSQPSPEVRQRLYQGLCTALRPGGYFLLEAKVDPSDPAGRYPCVEVLCGELSGLEILRRQEGLHELAEGRYHTGRQRTARIVARRPARGGGRI